MSTERPRRWPWSRRTAATDTPEPWVPTAWPADAAMLERWIRTELLAEAGADSEADGIAIDGLDSIRISAELAGADIVHLLLDATGLTLTMRAPESAGGAGDTPAPEVPAPEIVSRTPAMLRSARLTAQPLLMQGHPLHIDVTAADLPFDWVRYDGEQKRGRPGTAVGFEVSDADARPSGEFAFHMGADHVAPLIADVAAPLLATIGVRLRQLDCTISTSRRGIVTVVGDAAVRWKIFGASVRATASVHISPDAIVTVKRLRLRSFNPFVAFGLAMARSQLREIEGQVLDLNAPLAEEGGWSLKVRELHVTADDDIAVSGRFG